MRIFPRRQLLRAAVPRTFVRRQHDLPHKTYFQTPAQEAPAVTPPPYSQARSSTRSWISFLSNTVASGSAGAALGIAGALALVTYDYLLEVYEPGSEEDLDMLQSIEEIFNEHIGIIQLREDPDFQEINPYWHLSPEDQKRSMLAGPLNGARGVIWKMFWNEKLKSMVVYVFFGNGTEGWLDTLHGGMLTTVLQEAMERVAAYTFPSRAANNSSMNVAFIKRVRPGTIFQIRAQPDDLILDLKNGIASIPDTEERKKEATILGVLTLVEEDDGAGPHETVFVEAKGTFVASGIPEPTD